MVGLTYRPVSLAAGLEPIRAHSPVHLTKAVRPRRVPGLKVQVGGKVRDRALVVPPLERPEEMRTDCWSPAFRRLLPGIPAKAGTPTGLFLPNALRQKMANGTSDRDHGYMVPGRDYPRLCSSPAQDVLGNRSYVRARFTTGADTRVRNPTIANRALLPALIGTARNQRFSLPCARPYTGCG